MRAELMSEHIEPPCALAQVFEWVDLNAAWWTGGQAMGTLGWQEPLYLAVRAGSGDKDWPTHKRHGRVPTLSHQPSGSLCVLLVSLPVPQGFTHLLILAV